jgi:hypothetical protein
LPELRTNTPPSEVGNASRADFTLSENALSTGAAMTAALRSASAFLRTFASDVNAGFASIAASFLSSPFFFMCSA